jgi:Carboxypeptidase regulatory-like domain
MFPRTSVRGRLLLGLATIILGLIAIAPQSHAQVSVSTGAISGTVSDPQGASVPGAKVTVLNKESGFTQALESSSSGTFSVGALSPGTYTVKIEAKSFKTVQSTVVVQVGQVTSTNFKLELGAASTVVEVTETSIAVNSEQASVQDVLTAADIDQLPVNGRNFLDLATLEPGVQIQDGSTFDPTKNGYSSLSFGGRFGRTARIEVDGTDISDETVGTTTSNIPQSAIEEFQVASSSLDMSTELTSSGTVNVVTKSGTNDWHGQAFYYGRSNQLSAKIADATDPTTGLPDPGKPADLPFGRKQFGANLGSAIWKDKLFFFADFERTDQNLQDPVLPGGNFASLAGSFNSPFDEREYLARLDFNIKKNWTLFARFNYDQNLSVRGFNPGVYQPFENVDYTPAYVVGTDFTTSKTTNSIRFGFLKFRNSIVDGVALSGAPDPSPGISLNITPNGGDLACLAGGEVFCSGANILAPQQTFQEDRQIKYDGSYTVGKHTLRYGTSYNGILGGGFAKFFALQPMVQVVYNQDSINFASTSPYGPGGANNPLNYPISTILMGNGQGYSTERPGFGLPAGGQYDHRFDWYFGDQWKLMRNLTVTAGLHYGRDTGRTDSDLPSVSALAQFNNQFYNNLQNRVNQPNKNFGPQLGLAWDPWKNGKTVFRAGAGLYYENAIFNNVLFDRPGRLTEGLFLAEAAPCFAGSAYPVTGINNGNPVTYCGAAVGSAMAQIAADQKSYQAAIEAAGPGANPNFIGSTLQANNVNGIQMLAPDYVSPRSVQMNVGVQRQLGPGTVLSVDYVRNVGTHYLLGVDTNKVGDARFLNVPNAQAAIAATLSACGVSTIDAAITACPGLHPAVGSTPAGGATIADFASSGLDSGLDFNGGAPCPTCAFGGINPNLGQNEMLFPIGRSVYNGLLVELKSNLNHPLPGIRRMNIIASYTLSRFDSAAGDQDFVNNALDFNNPLRYYGPSALDRTHLVSVGTVIDFPYATRLALTAHYGSAVPITLTLPQAGTPGEIFRTDVTGDGTIGDPVPGCNVGCYGRSVKAGDINNFINNYNSKYAGQLTPAGQALVSAGLFSSAQLQALGAVTPTLANAPQGQVGVSPLFTFDAHISWELRLSKVLHALPERVILEPQAALYNVFNFHNYDPFGNILSGVLNGQPGSANGTTQQLRTNLITPGSASGVNWYAVPRQAEFGVKLTF